MRQKPTPTTEELIAQAREVIRRSQEDCEFFHQIQRSFEKSRREFEHDHASVRPADPSSPID